MKKICTLALLTMLSFHSYAQFDFILKGITSLGSEFLSADGAGKLANTAKDVDLIKEAIELVDGAVCMLENYDYNQPELDASITGGCYVPTDFVMTQQILDESLFTLAQELANASAAISGKIMSAVGGGSKPPPEVDRNNVSNALKNAQEVLKKEVLKRVNFEKWKAENLARIDRIKSKVGTLDYITDPKSSPISFVKISKNEEAERAKAKTRGDLLYTKIKSAKSKIIGFIILIMLTGTMIGIATGSTKINAGLLLGVISVVILLNVLNLLWK